MKKYLWVICILLFASCLTDVLDLGEETLDIPEQTRFTYVEFQNQGTFDVTIYSNSTRQTPITDVARGSSKQEKWPPNSDGFSFFLTYQLPIIGNYKMAYFPQPPLLDFVEVTIPRYQTTSVRIPDLESIITDWDKILSGDVYLRIRNDGTSGIRFYRFNSELTPVNGGSLISPREEGVYKITPAISGSDYTVWVGTNQYPMPSGLTLVAGYCYSLVFTGSDVSLVKETEITLNNIRAGAW